MAAGVRRRLSVEAGHAFEQLSRFAGEKKSWLFGHLSYDLKNEVEELSSRHPDPIGFPLLHFFEPEILIHIREDKVEVEAEDAEAVMKEIRDAGPLEAGIPDEMELRGRMSREDYIQIIQRLKAHIQRGDCYEINFCQEFYAENADPDPYRLFKKLSLQSPAPHAAFYRLDDLWLLCASPERFLKKQGGRVYSQPMKGTIARERDSASDERNKRALMESAKDRSENVMVVDLVRNDLSKFCRPGSVKVDELFGVYPFPQVWQMVSTVSGEPQTNDLAEIFRACFPMGSMTGAPKKRVMELIEENEDFRRGLFSGSVGYITPGGEFDFNVVIRSLLYNGARRYLSCMAGSGITIYSDPGKEWEECMLKAAALRRVVSQG